MSTPNDLTPRPFSAAPDEVEALLGALHRNRRTFAWKTGGLDADAMRRTLGPSTLTLGGLVKHLALVEDHYFTHQLLGRDYPAVWAPMAEDDEWEWTSAADDSPEELRTLWFEAVARSEAAVDEVLADGGPRQPARDLRLDRNAKPASGGRRHDRGVRPSHRPCRPDTRVDRRVGRRGRTAVAGSPRS